MLDEILTIQEVAEYLKVSRTTVWRWCNDGKLAGFKAGRAWRIHRSAVEEMVMGLRNDEGGNSEDLVEIESEKIGQDSPESIINYALRD